MELSMAAAADAIQRAAQSAFDASPAGMGGAKVEGLGGRRIRLTMSAGEASATRIYDLDDLGAASSGIEAVEQAVEAHASTMLAGLVD